jgi:hypothetical protein
MGNGWDFADLDPAQLALVVEAERTLETDVVMVFRPGAPSWADVERLADEGLTPVELDESQLECLQGLERQVGGVAVAYRRAAH